MIDKCVSKDDVMINVFIVLLQPDSGQLICFIIPAFQESSCDQVSGVNTIKPLISAKHQIHLFAFEDSDFISPHYQSVWPRTEQDLPSPSFIYPSTECEVSDVSIPPPSFDLTDIRSCELVINNESFQDILVVTTDTNNSR